MYTVLVYQRILVKNSSIKTIHTDDSHIVVAETSAKAIQIVEDYYSPETVFIRIVEMLYGPVLMEKK